MNGDEASQKTNTKLDTFLKKKLEPSVFEQLRYNEACIVVGDRYDKVFSYVILGHEWIYITENPPKSVKEEVHYRDVVGIELKNDLPDFLGGQERTNTLHAVITYRSPVRHKGLMKALSTKPGQRPTSPKPVHKSMSAPEFNMPPRPKSASPRLDRRLILSQTEMDPVDELETNLLSLDASSNESLDSLNASGRGLELRPSSPRPMTPSSPRSTTPRPSSPAFRSEQELLGSPTRDVPAPSSPRAVRGMRTQRGSLESDPGTNSRKSSDSGHHKESVLHLYMLKSDSPIVNHLTNAWNNYLLRGTLLCDLDYDLKTTQQRKSPQERLASLYDQLTHEVMLPNNSMEEVFSLMNELKTATEKNFVLKKFFWKYGDLFYYTVDHIKRYIPGQVTSADETPADRSKRADELELVNLLLEILSLELRETDVLPQRCHCLRQAKGRHLADLVVLCTSTPRLPAPYYVPSRKASELLRQLEADENRNALNQELSELAADFTRLSASVVYELFLLAKQDIYSSGTFINIGWLVGKIQEAKNLDSFAERICAQSMKFISATTRDQLSPKDAVLLYQQLYVMRTLVDQCPPVLAMLREKYMEEFKYYIQGPVLWSKLPPSFAISRPAILLLERIMSKVLKKDVRLAVPEVVLG